MTGDIAKAITLTTYGTAFLRDNYDISGLTLEHPSFIFTKKVEFHFFKKRFFGKPTWHLYADNPINWLKKLKQEGCKEIRLVFEPDNHHSLNGESIPDHKLAGFVGGGGYRFIQTVFSSHSDFWQSREEVTDKDAPDNKIWTVTYGRILTKQRTLEKRTYEINKIRQRLKSKLTEISAFAKKENEIFWAEWFDKALNLLNHPNPYVNDQGKSIVPTDKMGNEIIQLLAGARSAWCFGGMGSWNDIGFNDKDTQATYDKLTAELYDIVNESYLAVANSYE
jgi:hypothetical protein